MVLATIAIVVVLAAGACGSTGSPGPDAAPGDTSTTTTTAPPTAEQLQAALLTPAEMPGFAQYASDAVTESDAGGEPGGCPGPSGVDPVQKVKAGYYTDGAVLQVGELIFVNPPGTSGAQADWLHRGATCPPHDETVTGITYTVTPEGTVPAPEFGDDVQTQAISYSGGFVGTRIVYDVFCGDLRISVQVTQLGGPVDRAGAEQTVRTALKRVNAGLGREACTLPQQ